MFATRRRMLVRWFVALLPIVLLSALMQPAAGATPAADAVGPTAGALGEQWTATHDGPQKYPNIHIEWDVPITMSDGTVLKANVYRPADASGGPVAEQTPTILNLIPYTKLLSMLAQTGTSIPGFSQPIIEFFRNFDMTGTGFDGLTDVTRMLGGGMVRSFAADPDLIKSGYTQVIVDVRGTGFSQGKFQLFQQREQQDTLEVIDWAARQPWSNGKIGMSGVSYSAINQLKAAEEHPPALKAIFPVQPGGDLLRDLIAPGGGTGIGFIGPLLVFAINLPKLLPDVMSIVQGRFDWQWLEDRQASPMTLVPEGLQGLTIPSVDQLPPDLKELVDQEGSLRQGWIGHAEKVEVPAMIIGGWHDIFANSEPEIYNAIPLPPGKKQLIMGDNYHGMAGFAMRGPEYGEPPRIDVLQRAWFDHRLKGIDNGIETYGPVTSWQQGNGWTHHRAVPAGRDGTPQDVLVARTEWHRRTQSPRRQPFPAEANRNRETDCCTRTEEYLFAGRDADHDGHSGNHGLRGRRTFARAGGADLHECSGFRTDRNIGPHLGASEHRASGYRRLLDRHRQRCGARWPVDGADHRSNGVVVAQGRRLPQ